MGECCGSKGTCIECLKMYHSCSGIHNVGCFNQESIRIGSHLFYLRVSHGNELNASIYLMQHSTCHNMGHH